MPRVRSPNRDKARDIYLNSKGKVKLKDIAAELGVSDTQIRKWKNQDKWDDELKGTLPKGKRNVTNKKSNNKSQKKEPSNKKISEMIDSPELTDKQRLFAEIYVKNFNATQAAIKAGYAPDSAHVTGYDLLRNPKVRTYVQYLKELKKQSIMITEDDIVERYMRIAFADMTDFVSFGQKDIPVVFEVDPNTGQKIITTQRINTLNFKEDYEVDGGLICEIKVGKQGASLKLEDRQKALDWLAKYFDMNPDNKYRREFDNRKLQLEKERFEHQKKMDEKKDW